MRRSHLWDKWARALPPRALRPLALPLGRHSSTDDGFRWESARMLNMAFGFVRNESVLGDYAEFGVLEGRTFVEAWLASNRHGLRSMHLRAYDSFEGLPKTSGVDAGGPFYGGQFASPRAAFDRVTHSIPRQRVEVVPGYFAETLQSARQAPVAVAWVDCDLYESTLPVLDYLTEQLVDGAVLIFDDWYCFRGRPDRGEQLACAQWLARNTHIRLVPYRSFHWAGQSFIVNRIPETGQAPGE